MQEEQEGEKQEEGVGSSSHRYLKHTFAGVELRCIEVSTGVVAPVFRPANVWSVYSGGSEISPVLILTRVSDRGDGQLLSG